MQNVIGHPAVANWTISELKPFGRLLQAPPGGQLGDVSISWLRELVRRHRVLVVRNTQMRSALELEQHCRKWGELLTWPFGHVLELRYHEDATNYLFTRGNVPFHWDGAFADVEPSFLFFQCRQAPGAGRGGETIFCDTTRVLDAASKAQWTMWTKIEIEYKTEKLAHYGGRRLAPLVSRHPYTGQTTLRFAEPLNQGSVSLNPIELCVFGCADDTAFLRDLIPALYAEDCCYRHSWQTGDVLIADNHALLHGRDPYDHNAERHLERVHIL